MVDEFDALRDYGPEPCTYWRGGVKNDGFNIRHGNWFGSGIRESDVKLTPPSVYAAPSVKLRPAFCSTRNAYIGRKCNRIQTCWYLGSSHVAAVAVRVRLLLWGVGLSTVGA